MYVLAMTVHEWPFATPVYRLTLSQLVLLANVRVEMYSTGESEPLSNEDLQKFSPPSR